MPPRAVSRIIVVITLILVVTVAASIGVSLLTSAPSAKRPEVVYPLTIADDLGRNVTIAKKAVRIVSLIPSSTEILFALGAGDRVVGVTRYDDYPAELVERVKIGNITVVGGGFDPDIEKVVVLRPDIIFVDGPGHIASKPLQRLLELGFTVVAFHPSSIDGVLKNILLAGKILGIVEKAEAEVSIIKLKIDSVIAKTKNAPKVKVYVENWHNPLFSVGPGSLQHEMVELAGGINLFADLPKPSTTVSAEAVIARNPEVIINFNILIAVEDIKSRPGWDQIKAVRDNKVFQMHPKEGAPNPRIGDSLLKMAKFIHPELFPSTSSSSAQLIAMPARPIIALARLVAVLPKP